MSAKETKREAAIRKTVKKRNKRRKRRLLLFFSAFMMIALAVVVVLSATVLFPVKNVIVEGQCAYTDEEIISASGIEDDNIIMLSGSKVKNRISKNLPHCGEITVKKEFPDTVKITVKAAVLTYYFVSDEVFYITDADYKVIEKAVAAPEGCKLLKITDFAATSPGDKVKFTDNDNDQIEDISALCTEMSLAVTALDVSSDSDLKIIVDDRLLVLLGSDIDLDGKLLHLSAMLPEMTENAQGTVDLRSWTSTSTKSTFRDEKINIFEFTTQKAQKINENS